MSNSLLWLISFFCCHIVTGDSSCKNQGRVTYDNLGDCSNHCEHHIVPNDDLRSYSCDRNKETEIPIFRGVYTFPVDPIPRKNCFDEEAMQFLQDGYPVVLENCTFHKPAMKWTVNYLKENLKDEDHTAYFSKDRIFLYYDDDRIKGAFKEWHPPTKRMLMYFTNFSELMDELETANNGSRAYFQSLVYLQDGVSDSLWKDVNSFNYSFLLDLVTRLNWGEDVSNLLLVGMPDVVTPAHFDILENLYVQIFGRKRVILFSPDYFRSLYPYPVGHPHDRQTQVNFENPDLSKFPRFSEIRGMEVSLEPDEVLYIPNYWWHYIESESHSKTISMNFWFDPKNDTKTKSDNATEKVDTSSVQLETGEDQQEGGSLKTDGDDAKETQSNGDGAHALSESEQNKDTHPEGQVKIDDRTKVSSEETTTEPEAEKEEAVEEDEKEIELSASQYIALLRETETSLFKATFSHKKVKQILEDLLSRRFDYIKELY